MEIETTVMLQTDELKAGKWVNGDDGELRDLSPKETVKGDSLTMFAGDVKSLVGEDLRDMAKLIISLQARVTNLEAKLSMLGGKQ